MLLIIIIMVASFFVLSFNGYKRAVNKGLNQRIERYEKSIDSGVTISNVVIVIFRREGGSFFYPDGPF